MKLNANKPGMILAFHNFRQLIIGRQTAENQSGFF